MSQAYSKGSISPFTRQPFDPPGPMPSSAFTSQSEPSPLTNFQHLKMFPVRSCNFKSIRLLPAAHTVSPPPQTTLLTPAGKPVDMQVLAEVTSAVPRASSAAPKSTTPSMVLPFRSSPKPASEAMARSVQEAPESKKASKEEPARAPNSVDRAVSLSSSGRIIDDKGVVDKVSASCFTGESLFHKVASPVSSSAVRASNCVLIDVCVWFTISSYMVMVVPGVSPGTVIRSRILGLASGFGLRKHCSTMSIIMEPSGPVMFSSRGAAMSRIS
mmetsp:Transcript_45934/g.56373  ORF Transcript_45934/g.56373 Transcript_45934/m.56373 type:complete len:271 (-) Transcript_45934:84-896(-)